MNKRLKLLIEISISFFSALYLTILIDTLTLATRFERLFVFCVFFAIVFGLSFKALNMKKNEKALIYACIFSICLVVLGKTYSLYKYAHIEVTPVGKGNEQAQGEEVRIKDIIVDGKSILNTENYKYSGWYLDEAGNIVSYNEENTEKLVINIKFSQKYEMIFVGHAWSGNVSISTNGVEETKELYSFTGEEIIYSSSVGEYILCANNVLSLFGSTIFFVLMLYMIFTWAIEKEMLRLVIKCICCTGLLWNGLCGSVVYLFVLLISGILYFITNDEWTRVIKEKYKKCHVVILLISLYCSFCLVGRETFIYGNTKNLAFIFTFVLSWNIITETLVLFEKLGSRKNNIVCLDEKKDLVLRDKLFLFLKNMALAAFMAWMIGNVIDDYVIKSYQPTTVRINALGQNGKLNEGNEVIFCSLQVDGKNVKIEDYVTSRGVWEVIWDTQFVYHYTQEPSELVLEFPEAKSIRLYFSNYWLGGKAEIIDGKEIVNIDFSANDKNYSNNYYVYDVKSNIVEQSYLNRYICLYVLLGSILFLIISFIDILKYRYTKISIRETKMFWLCFGLCSFVWNIMCYAYFPGNWSWDNLYQWAQADKMVPLSDGHPIIMTLFMRLLMQIYKHPYLLVESLILLSSITTASIYSSLFKSFKKKHIGYIVLLTLSPAVLLMISNPLKDSFHMIFMALSIFYLYMLLRKPEYFKRPYVFCGLIITLFCIVQLRHEGLISLLVVSGLVIILSLKQRVYSLLFAVIFSIGLSGWFNGYKDELVKESSDINMVLTDTNSTLTTVVLSDLSRVLYDKEELSYSSLEFMETYLEIERFKQLYSPFDRDSLGFNDEYIVAAQTNSGKYSALDLVKVYLNELIHNPRSIILARLDAINGLWYIGNDNVEMFYGTDGIMTFLCVGPKEFGFVPDESGCFKADNRVSKLIRPVMDYIKECKLLNVIFLNVGISIIALFIICLFLWKNNRKLLYLSIPVIIRILVLALVIGCQHFRYFYSVRLMIVVFALLVFNESNWNEEATESDLNENKE